MLEINLIDAEGLDRLASYAEVPTEALIGILNSVAGEHIYDITNSARFCQMMQNKGFDGIEAHEARGRRTFAAFRAEQIKKVTRGHGKQIHRQTEVAETIGSTSNQSGLHRDLDDSASAPVTRSGKRFRP